MICMYGFFCIFAFVGAIISPWWLVVRDCLLHHRLPDFSRAMSCNWFFNFHIRDQFRVWTNVDPWCRPLCGRPCLFDFYVETTWNLVMFCALLLCYVGDKGRRNIYLVWNFYYSVCTSKVDVVLIIELAENFGFNTLHMFLIRVFYMEDWE